MKTMAIVGACVASGLIATARQSASEPGDVPVGTWTGTGRISAPNIRNPVPAPHNLVVQRLADPHWRWRGGPKEILTIGVRGRGAGGAYEVSRVEYRGKTLSYSYTRPAGDVTCSLVRQDDERFEGDCVGAGFNAHVILTQPAPVVVEASAGTVQGFALGRWIGTRVTPEGANSQPASMLLTTPPNSKEMLQATFTLPAGTFDARNLQVDGGTIAFQFGTGAGSCKLARQADGRLEGNCTNPAGAPLVVTLTPPPQAAPRP
jgi:hypothetical protein